MAVSSAPSWLHCEDDASRRLERVQWLETWPMLEAYHQTRCIIDDGVSRGSMITCQPSNESTYEAGVAKMAGYVEQTAYLELAYEIRQSSFGTPMRLNSAIGS